MQQQKNEKFELIEKIINENDVAVFMKGSKLQPQCGFSALVVNILQKLNVDFKDINVLESEDMRQNIKDFSDWPTVPQLYIKNEFIGGSDIVKEMYANGDLEKLLTEKNILTA